MSILYYYYLVQEMFSVIALIPTSIFTFVFTKDFLSVISR